jgi:hypothetical protein
VIADCWRGDLSRYPYVSQQATPAVIRSVKAMSVAMVGGSADTQSARLVAPVPVVVVPVGHGVADVAPVAST